MKYATVLEGSFDPSRREEGTTVKMELTPPPIQKSRVGIHPELFGGDHSIRMSSREG